jgi:hypothetical protein
MATRPVKFKLFRYLVVGSFPISGLHRTWPRYRWIRFFELADDDVDSGLRTIKCFGCAGETLLSRDRKKYVKLGVATASALVAI